MKAQPNSKYIQIPHNRPSLGHEEDRASHRVLSSGWLAQGIEVKAFEEEFCEFIGAPANSAAAVSSGTSALYLAIWALQQKKKITSVSLPVYVCAALRNAAKMANLQIQYVDSAKNSPNLDSTQVSGDLLVLPHMFGIPVNAQTLGTKIPIIEDCAQSLGARVGNTFCGLQTELGIFSFYATKLITTGGQGGLIVSKDKSLIESIRDYREFDCRDDSKIRFNFQMTDLQAAIGRAQLQKLRGFLNKREEIFEIYRSHDLPLVGDKLSKDLHPIRYRAVVKTPRPQDLIDHLSGHGIKAIVPVEDWELLAHERSLYPNAIQFSHETVSLPIFPDLNLKDAEAIAQIVKEFLK